MFSSFSNSAFGMHHKINNVVVEEEDPLPKLSLPFSTDGADDSGNGYNGTVYGSCVDTTRSKFYTKSLTSDGTVGTSRYVEMPAVPLNNSFGMTMSFHMYPESGAALSADSRIFEIERDGVQSNRIYISRYKSFQDKFRFCDGGSGVFTVPAIDTWIKVVITITAADVINLWASDVKYLTDYTKAGIMPLIGFNAGWHIGGNISNTGNLTSFNGSFQDFKVWNRVLTDTEVSEIP